VGRGVAENTRMKNLMRLFFVLTVAMITAALLRSML
jgi:hypothetical protein